MHLKQCVWVVVFSLLVKGLFICVWDSCLFYRCVFFSEVQRKMQTGSGLCPADPPIQVTPDGPECQALVHCGTWDCRFWSPRRMPNKGYLSPSVSDPVLLLAVLFLSLSVPRQPQGPPSGEIMGRSLGLIWQDADGIKLEPGGATLGSSHPLRASFHSPGRFWRQPPRCSLPRSLQRGRKGRPMTLVL